MTPWPFIICFCSLIFHGYYFPTAIFPLIAPLPRWVRWAYWFLQSQTMLNLLCTYATNAGLLPWNWSATRKKLYTAAEIRDGIATTLEEFEWAASHDAPARAHFSKPWASSSCAATITATG
jgi:hypothetical protein